MRFLIALMFFSTISNAQLLNNQKAELAIKNYLKNPGGEQSTRGWSVSAGTLASETTTVRNGAGSISFNAANAAETLSTTLVAIPAGDGACFAEFYYYGFGTADMRLYIKDNSANVIGGYTSTDTTWAIATAATAWTKVQIPFGCPASGTTVQLALEAQGDAAIGYVDDAYLGRDFRIGESFESVLSASVSSSDAVTLESPRDWINGNCTSATTGRAICTFNTGFFSVTPNCVVTASSTDGQNTCAYSSLSSTGIQVDCDNDATATDLGFNLVCQKSAIDAQTILRGDMSDLSGFANHAGTASCEWGALAGASMASFSVDADCPTPSLTGNVAAPATKKPAFQAVKLVPGKYLVIANGFFYCGESTVSSAICSFEIYDGTTSGGQISFSDSASKGTGTASNVVGFFNYTSSQSSKEFEIRARRDNGNGTGAFVNGTYGGLQFSLIPLSGALPRPFIPGSVFAGRSSVVKMGTALLNCDGASAITANTDAMVSAIGNIATGTCAVTLTTGYFSATPDFCSVMQSINGGTAKVMSSVEITSATALNVRCRDNANTDCTSWDAYLMCVGNN